MAISLTSKIVFFGTPAFAVPCLKAILESRRQVPLVVTQPDRPVGRGKKTVFSPIKKFCLEQNLSILQPKKIRQKEFLDQLQTTQARIYVVAAFGRILPAKLLEIPELIINVHASLLPRWRGAAPIERAIMAGDTQTGISIMKLVEELDAGDVMLQTELPIGPDITGGELRDQLAKQGAQTLINALDLLDRGQAEFKPQDSSLVTYAPPIQVEEAKIQWDQEASTIHNQIRAFHPKPGAYTFDSRDRLKILRTALSDQAVEPGVAPGTLQHDKKRLWVAAKDQWLKVLELQREGRTSQTSDRFIPGYPFKNFPKWG